MGGGRGGRMKGGGWRQWRMRGAGGGGQPRITVYTHALLTCSLRMERALTATAGQITYVIIN